MEVLVEPGFPATPATVETAATEKQVVALEVNLET